MLVLYSSDTTNFDNLGLGVLRDFKSDPEITEVLNGLYNLEFDYIKDGWLSEHLIEGNIIKAKGQLFRIRSVDKTIKETKITVLAKHIWFDLEINNWLEDVAPTNMVGHEALDWILSRTKIHNNFTVTGDCTKVASARYVRMNPIEAIYNADNALLNRFGGEIEVNNYNIILHNQRGSSTGIEIRQKKNVNGASYKVDLSSLATRIMPVGNDGILLPEKYIDSPLINNYYAPFYRKLDVNIGVDEENGITLNDCYTAMRKAVQDAFDSGIDKPNVSISIDFVELSKTEEYSMYSNLETAHLGDSCKVYIPSLNINLTARIVKTIYNDAKKRITKLELGTPTPNYVKSTNEIKNTIANLDSTESILATAKRNATNIVNHPFGGYIFISEDTGELYIMDTNNISTAQKVWKFGLGGLGFSSTGINGPYTIAMTQDGRIVGDFITAGTIDTSVLDSDVITTRNFAAQEINADQITSGNINANLIKSGTLSGVLLQGDTIKGSVFTGNTENVKLQIGTDSDGYMVTDNSLELLCDDVFKIFGIYVKKFATGVQTTYFKTDANAGFYFMNPLGVPQLEAGNMDCGTTTLNSNNVITVNFNKTFPSIPKVVITPHTSIAGAIPPKVRDVTTTYFTATIGGSISGNIDCDWIAISS